MKRLFVAVWLLGATLSVAASAGVVFLIWQAALWLGANA